MSTQNAMVNDKKEIFGWAMYDWGNSAFSTTIGTVFLAPYVAALAADAAKADFLVKTGTAWEAATSPALLANFFGIPVAPDSFMGYCISISVFLQVFLLPILGAIADYSQMRKLMMRIFATIGAVTTILMFFINGDSWWMGGLLYIVANVAFGAAFVFYNAYLPDLASEDQRDRVSSFGWAMGYLGGGLLLALNLGFYLSREKLGIPTDLAIRINLASAGLWWLGWSFITWARVRPRGAHRPLPKGETYFSISIKQLLETLKDVRHYPETLKFLLAYLFYNDGIQTVIAMAAIFATAPLVRGGLGLDTGTLTIIILIIQFVAFFGALFWGRLAKWMGAKQSVILSLTIWAGVIIYSYFGLRSDQLGLEFGLLGVVIALVLGGSQAISRSLFSQMIPQGKEAEYYSFYEISDRGTSWIGPALFAVVNQTFENLRPAILSLMVLFILGLVILPFVNVKKAYEDVKRVED